MPDIYRIGVSIAMTNGVSSVLKVIQKDLFGLKRQVDFTQGSFDRLKRAAAGAIAVGVGVGALRGWMDLAKAGSEITNQQGKMLQLGISYRDVVNETAVAMKVASQISGSTSAGNLASLITLRSQLGNLANANAALPAYAKAQFVLTSNGYDPSQLDYFVKALDVQGAFVNKKTGELDPNAFATSLKEAIAAVLTTGGLLNGQGFYQASRLSNPAGQAMGTETYLKNMTEVLVALGNRGARGLEYAATDFIGGKMSKAQIAMLERLKLLSPKDVEYAGGGNYVADTARLKGADLLMKGDLIDWLKQYFVGAANAQGISALQAGSSFQQTLQSLISFLSTNWAQIQRSQQQQAQAQKTDQYSVAQKMYNGSVNDFTTALTNLLQNLGVPAMGQAVEILRPLADGIRQLGGWIGAHPEYAAAISKTLLGLGAALTVLGGAAVLTSIAAMLGTGGTIALVSAGLITLATAIQTLESVLPDIFPSANHTHMHEMFAKDRFRTAYWVPDAGYMQKNGIIVPIPPPAPPRPSMSSLSDHHGVVRVQVVNTNDIGPATHTGPGPRGSTHPQSIAGDVYLDGRKVGKWLTGLLTAPQTGPTGTNLRATPSGGAGLQMLGRS